VDLVEERAHAVEFLAIHWSCVAAISAGEYSP